MDNEYSNFVFHLYVPDAAEPNNPEKGLWTSDSVNTTSEALALQFIKLRHPHKQVRKLECKPLGLEKHYPEDLQVATTQDMRVRQYN